jgi:protein SCO1/2
MSHYASSGIYRKRLVILAALAVFDCAARAQAPKLPDVELFDQYGNKVHFYTGLVKGRTVAIDFIFTACQTICPLLGANFAKVNQLLGKDASKFLLISISVDPANDTPASLRAYAARFGAAPEWRLLTGEKRNVDELLRSLGAYTADRIAHTPEVLIGNAQSPWIRADGLGAPARIAELLRSVP